VTGPAHRGEVSLRPTRIGWAGFGRAPTETPY